jgi:hypothetical protein
MAVKDEDNGWEKNFFFLFFERKKKEERKEIKKKEFKKEKKKKWKELYVLKKAKCEKESLQMHYYWPKSAFLVKG